MSIVLVIAALLPAIGLAIYIYLRDRVEKEPVGLLLLLLLAGALSTIPVLVFSLLIGDPIITAVFDNFVTVYEDGSWEATSNTAWYLYNFVEYFIGVALVEEICKWGMLVLFTRKNKNFNSTFDGIVYAVFVSLGFAALENILYVLDYGFATAVTRAIMSVPGHMFFGVLMGFYYSHWKIRSTAGALERGYAREGKLTLSEPIIHGKKDMLLAVLIPTLAHGFYDFALSVGNVVFMLLCLVFLGFLYFYCFRTVRRMARADGGIYRYAKVLVLHKYNLTDADVDPVPAPPVMVTPTVEDTVCETDDTVTPPPMV